MKKTIMILITVIFFTCVMGQKSIEEESKKHSINGFVIGDSYGNPFDEKTIQIELDGIEIELYISADYLGKLYQIGFGSKYKYDPKFITEYSKALAKKFNLELDTIFYEDWAMKFYCNKKTLKYTIIISTFDNASLIDFNVTDTIFRDSIENGLFLESDYYYQKLNSYK